MAVKPGESGAGAGEGDKSSGATFDPIAFKTELKTELLAELNKNLNGLATRFRDDIGKLIPKARADGDGAGDGAGSGDDKSGAGDGKGVDKGTGSGDGVKSGEQSLAALNAKLSSLTKQVTTLTEENKQEKQKREEAEKSKLETDRVSQIRTVLAGIEFADDKSRNLFFNAYKDQVKRDDNGQLVVETTTGPMVFDEYLKLEAEASPNLLAAKVKGGAGANAGSKVGGKTLDYSSMSANDMMKLTPEQRAAGLQEAVRSLVPSA